MNKDYIDNSQRMINQGHDMQTLKEDERFQFLMKQLATITSQAEADIKSATSWDDFLTKKGMYQGLIALSREIDTIIARGKTKERILKK